MDPRSNDVTLHASTPGHGISAAIVDEALSAWDGQQACYTPRQNERWTVAEDLIGQGSPGVVVDVGCGPGTLTTRLAARLRSRSESWRVVGLEADGFLLALARCRPSSVEWVQGIRIPQRSQACAAVLSSAVTHYYSADVLTRYYVDALAAVGPDGSVITIEELPETPDALDESIGPWQEWWDNVEREPSLRALRDSHPRPAWPDVPTLSRAEHLECVNLSGGVADIVWADGASVVLQVRQP